MGKSASRDPLGHGDHWSAIFPDWSERLTEFLPWLAKTSQFQAKFTPPWPDDRFKDMLRMAHDVPPSVELTVLLGVDPDAKTLCFVSCYPTFRETRVWSLPVARISDDYGPYEGVVDFTTASGATLRCFDPSFGENRSAWHVGGSQAVALSALALRIAPYEAKPFQITKGPLLEMERDRLRQDGDPAAADALDHIDVHTDTIRTLYSGESHDHSAFVGRVETVRDIPAHDPLPAGWLLEVELMPDEDQPSAERSLPVYVFPAALDNGTPRVGDLIQGYLWVQATPHSSPS